MGKDDLVLSDVEEKEKDPEKSSKKSGKKKGSKARRVTRTRRLGVQDDTVKVKIASDISEYSTPLSNFRLLDQVVPFGYDSNFQLTSDRCIIDEEGFSIRSLKRSTSVGMSRGSSRYPPYAVIDPGAEMEVIGGVGWRILHFPQKSETLNGALTGMGSEVLPTVDAVTAVEDEDGRVILLGIGEAAFDRRTTQHESLWNSHHLRSHNIVVDDVAKKDGGGQCIILKDQEGNERNIPLKFNGDIMTVNLRAPTEDELLALRVNWLTPPMEKLTP